MITGKENPSSTKQAHTTDKSAPSLMVGEAIVSAGCSKNVPGRGRGRGRTLPAWMTKQQQDAFMDKTVVTEKLLLRATSSSDNTMEDSKPDSSQREEEEQQQQQQANKHGKSEEMIATDEDSVALERPSKLPRVDTRSGFADQAVKDSSTRIHPDDAVVVHNDDSIVPVLLKAVSGQLASGTVKLNLIIKLCAVCHVWKKQDGFTKGRWKVAGKKLRVCKVCLAEDGETLAASLVTTTVENKDVEEKLPAKELALETIFSMSPTTGAGDCRTNSHSTVTEIKTIRNSVAGTIVKEMEGRTSTVPLRKKSIQGAPSLPYGWKCFFDRRQGQYYYHNSFDGTTSWDPPSVNEDVTVESNPYPAPSEWAGYSHPEYYECSYRHTSQNKWTSERSVRGYPKTNSYGVGYYSY